MGKSKIEKFTDFRYTVSPGKDSHFVDVKCSFKYLGLNIQHFIMFINQGPMNDKYVNDAKKQIKDLKDSGKLEKIAKKYLDKTSPNPIKRHKKPLIIIGVSILVAAIAAGVTVLTYNLLHPGYGTSVTEEEIDEYLKIPGGIIKPLDPIFSAKVRLDAISNLETKVNRVEVKNLSSYPFHTASKNETPENNVNSSNKAGITTYYNDTTGLYLDNKLKAAKDIFGTYVDINLHTNQESLPAYTISATDTGTTIRNGNEFKTNVVTKQTYLAQKLSGDKYTPYIKTNMDYQGFKMNETYDLSDEPLAKGEVSKFFNNEVLQKTLQTYVDLRLLSSNNYFTDNNGLVYCASYEETEGAPIQTGASGDTPIMIPTKERSVSICRFREIADYGWVLDSYAADGRSIFGITESPLASNCSDKSIYVEYDSNNKPLAKPFAINKTKGFVRFHYGKTTTTDTSSIEHKNDEHIWSYRKIYLKELNDAVPKDNVVAEVTPYCRADDPTFNKIKYFGSWELEDVSDEPQCYLIAENLDGNTPTFAYENLDEASKKIVEKGNPISEGTEKPCYIKFTTPGTYYFELTFKNSKFEEPVFSITKGF